MSESELIKRMLDEGKGTKVKDIRCVTCHYSMPKSPSCKKYKHRPDSVYTQDYCPGYHEKVVKINI